MGEFIPPSRNLEDTAIVKRAWELYGEVSSAIRSELGTPDVLHPVSDAMKFGAQVQSARGTSAEYLVAMNFETEIALANALGCGLLLRLAKMSVGKVLERIEFLEHGIIRVRFNSWEYISQKGDGFHRHREGDWRDEYEFSFDGDGGLIEQPGIAA